MLKQIAIQNFRSCHDLVISDIGSITALVGQNAAGKTNILKAIQWAAQCATAASPIKYDYALKDEARIVFVVQLGARNYTYLFQLSVVATPDGSSRAVSLKESLSLSNGGDQLDLLFERDGESIKILSRNGAIQTNSAMPALQAIRSLLPADRITLELTPIVEFLENVRYYAFDEPNEPDRIADFPGHDEYIKWLNAPSYEKEDSLSFRILHLQRERPAEFKELIHLLGASGLNLLNDIIIREVEGDKKASEDKDATPLFYVFYYYPTNAGSTSFWYSQLSVGTRRLLRIVTTLVHDSSSLLLIEQPEDTIHLGLLTKLIPLLRAYSDQKQFMMATHSTAVFDRLEATEIRLVSMTEGQTQARSLSAEEIRAAELYIANDGSLSDFLESIEED